MSNDATLTKARAAARAKLARGLDCETSTRLAEYRRIMDSDGKWSLTISLDDWSLMLELQELERQRLIAAKK